MSGRMSATVCVVLFFAVAFVLRFFIRRSTLSARRTKGRIYAGWSTRYIFFAYLAVFGFAIAEYFIFPRIPVPAVSAAGLALYAAGIAGRQWARRSLGTLWSVDIEVRRGQRIVRTGPYRFMRHPNNFFHILEMAGICLVPNSWLALAVFVAGYLPVIVFRSVAEERAMEKELGPLYSRYRKETSGILPFFPKRG